MTENCQGSMALRTRFADEYKKCYSTVYSHLLRRTRNCDTAEDLTQEAFRKAFESLDSFHEGASFSTWMHAIAEHVALDYHRARNTRAAFYYGTQTALPEKDKQDWIPDENHQHPFLGGLEYALTKPNSNTPEQDAITCEEVAEVKKYITTALSEKLRRAYALHLQGYTDREIATQLGMKEQAVTSRIHRAQQQIRNYLLEQSA